MKRFYDDNGEICSGEDLREAEKLVHKAFNLFVGAGYCHRDFIQFLKLECSLCESDFEIERVLGSWDWEEETE
jgi:hypothetical protein